MTESNGFSPLAPALVDRSQIRWASCGGRKPCSTRSIRSFADSNGDGVRTGTGWRAGQFTASSVSHATDQSVTVRRWHHGYDVADPRDIDPLFGGMPALERLAARHTGRASSP